MTRKKVLIIEDHFQLLHSLCSDLREEYIVIKATNGVSGLKAAYLHRPDLIILDLLLPKMSGEDFIYKIRTNAWGSNVKIIILSNIEDTVIKKSLEKFNISDYLIKCNTSLKNISQLIRIQFN